VVKAESNHEKETHHPTLFFTCGTALQHLDCSAASGRHLVHHCTDGDDTSAVVLDKITAK
jgi:hypothetical protein